MKKLITGIAMVAVAGMASAAIVDFDAADSGVGQGLATWDVGGTEGVGVHQSRVNFSTTTSMFTEDLSLYGGVNVQSYKTDGSVATSNITTGVILADGSSWPPSPMVLVNSSADGGAAYYNNVNSIYLWQKADFEESGTISFNSSSKLDVNLTTWYEQKYITGYKSIDIRHIIRQVGQAADTYWISETNATASGTFTLTDFNNNSTEGKRWAEIVLTSTDFDIGNKLDSVTWVAKDFDDVDAVGWIGEGSKSYGGVFGFDTYSATVGTAEPTPDPATLSISADGSSIEISWLPNLPGYTLQEISDLLETNWVDSARSSTNHPISIPVTGTSMFYRVLAP